MNQHISVTVTETLVLRRLLEDRGRITESICILVPVDRVEEKCFQITTKKLNGEVAEHSFVTIQSTNVITKQYFFRFARNVCKNAAVSPVV